jgi:hypothetical protein
MNYDAGFCETVGLASSTFQLTGFMYAKYFQAQSSKDKKMFLEKVLPF